MSRLQNYARLATPRALRAAFRSWRSGLRARRDCRRFPAWLARHCDRAGKRAVVVWRAAALGDLVCTFPLAREIRRRHPDALLVFITSRGYEPLVEFSGVADLIYGIEYIYGTPAWITAAAAQCEGRVERIYQPLTADEKVPGTGVPIHLIDDLAGSCGIEVTDRQPRLTVPEKIMSDARAKFDLPPRRGTPLVIGINCGRTWPVREWEAARWQQLVDALHARYHVIILQFGVGHPDPRVVDPYRSFSGVRRLIQMLSAQELVALVACCDLVISIDSGPVHLAGAVGTPVLGLFGAVAPAFRLPPDSPAVGIFHEVPCLFCHHRTPIAHWQENCPHDIRCMKGLQVKTVLETACDLLDSRVSS